MNVYCYCRRQPGCRGAIEAEAEAEDASCGTPQPDWKLLLKRTTGTVQMISGAARGGYCICMVTGDSS